MPKAINAQNLDAVHAHVTTTVQLWTHRLITDKELADELSKVAASFADHATELAGLIDPNTGLRYGG
jgi:hypothetical protein